MTDDNGNQVNIRSVVMQREISRGVCKEWENYFWEGSFLVVKGGCKGVFVICWKPLPTTAAPLTTTPGKDNVI